MTNRNNDVVKSITIFELFGLIYILAENYRYLLYKYGFSHLDFHTDLNQTIIVRVLLDQLCID